MGMVVGYVLVYLLLIIGQSCSGEQQRALETLRIEENVVDFGVQQLCVPAVRSFVIAYPLDGQGIGDGDRCVDGSGQCSERVGKELPVVDWISWSSPNTQFSIPLFQSTKIGPGENATVQIVFVPSQLGHTRSVVYLETSIGRFVVHVHGTVIENQFGVKPLIGDIVSSRKLYQPSITMRNPGLLDGVNVTEVFTTEGFLHLRLPEEQNWHLPPSPINSAEQKIVSLAFQSHIPGTYRSFVRVKMSRGPGMLIPVEVTVLGGGLHVSPRHLDLGTFVINGQQKRKQGFRPLAIHNFGKKTIKLVAVAVLTDPVASGKGGTGNLPNNKDEPLKSSFVHALHKAGLVLESGASDDAAILVNVKHEEEEEVDSQQQRESGIRREHGQILIFTNDTNPMHSRIVIPYTVTLVPHQVEVKPSSVSFQYGSIFAHNQSKTARITITNNFDVPISLVDVTIAASNVVNLDENVLSFVNHTEIERLIGYTLTPKEKVFVDVEATITDGSKKVGNCIVHMKTNVSNVDVPVNFFDGEITVQAFLKAPNGEVRGLSMGSLDSKSFRDRKLDIGQLPSMSEYRFYLSLQNANQKPIRVETVSYVHEGPLEMVVVSVDDPTLDVVSKPLLLREHSNLTYEVVVRPSGSVTNEIVSSHVLIQTELADYLVQVSAIVVPGHAQLEKETFSITETVWVGERLIVGDLALKNSIPLKFDVYQRVSEQDGILRLEPSKTSIPKSKVESGQVSVSLGQMFLDMNSSLCSTPACASLLSLCDHQADDPHYENMLTRRKMFEDRLRGNGLTVPLYLETSLSGLSFLVTVHLKDVRCPKLVGEATTTQQQQHELQFPKTQVGTESEQYVLVVNPSQRHSLAVQLNQLGNTTSRGPFHVPKALQEKRYVIPRGESRKIGPVLFAPTSTQLGALFGSFVLTNNLTGMEMVSVKGVGALAQVELVYSKSIESSNLPVALQESLSGNQESLDSILVKFEDYGHIGGGTSDAILHFEYVIQFKNVGDIPIHIDRIDLVDLTRAGFELLPSKSDLSLNVDSGANIDVKVTFQSSDCTLENPASLLRVILNTEQQLEYGFFIAIAAKSLRECEDARVYASYKSLLQSTGGILLLIVLVYVATNKDKLMKDYLPAQQPKEKERQYEKEENGHIILKEEQATTKAVLPKSSPSATTTASAKKKKKKKTSSSFSSNESQLPDAKLQDDQQEVIIQPSENSRDDNRKEESEIASTVSEPTEESSQEVKQPEEKTSAGPSKQVGKQDVEEEKEEKEKVSVLSNEEAETGNADELDDSKGVETNQITQEEPKPIQRSREPSPRRISSQRNVGAPSKERPPIIQGSPPEHGMYQQQHQQSSPNPRQAPSPLKKPAVPSSPGQTLPSHHTSRPPMHQRPPPQYSNNNGTERYLSSGRQGRKDEFSDRRHYPPPHHQSPQQHAQQVRPPLRFQPSRQPDNWRLPPPGMSGERRGLVHRISSGNSSVGSSSSTEGGNTTQFVTPLDFGSVPSSPVTRGRSNNNSLQQPSSTNSTASARNESNTFFPSFFTPTADSGGSASLFGLPDFSQMDETIVLERKPTTTQQQQQEQQQQQPLFAPPPGFGQAFPDAGNEEMEPPIGILRALSLDEPKDDEEF